MRYAIQQIPTIVPLIAMLKSLLTRLIVNEDLFDFELWNKTNFYDYSAASWEESERTCEKDKTNQKILFNPPFKPKMITACKTFLKCGAMRGALRLARSTAMESKQK